VLYLKFLKDLKISQLESDILKTISQITWLAIFLVILATIGLWPNLDLMSNPEWLLVGLVVIIILTINEATLNLLVAPKLIDISFNRKEAHPGNTSHKLRQLSFIISLSSVFSWYFILITYNLTTIINLPFHLLLFIYTGLII